MTVTEFDFKEFILYKNLGDEVKGIVDTDECLECIYPELRHFVLPKPRKLLNGRNENGPTNSSSSAPATSPTALVTNKPTVINESRTRVPTNDISKSPSSPSTSSTTSPTSSKDASGNGKESSPSQTPSSTNTAPTFMPSETRNRRPPTGCLVDQTGTFLLPQRKETVLERNIIGYKYKIETGKDSANISTEVLPFLENALLDAMLPMLFANECGSRRLMETSHFNHRRLSSIVGASSNPVDVVSEDEICGADANKDCFIINGKMTFMTDAGNYDLTSTEEMICALLEDESIRFAHPAITSISCMDSVGNRIKGEDVDEVGKSTPTFEPVSQRIGAYSYLVSVAAAVVIILGIYGYKRRHNKKEDKVAVGPLDDSDLANMSNSLSYEGTGPYTCNPAMDFTCIHKTAYTAQGGIDAMARQSYFPERMIESSDEGDSELAEISLDELNRTTNSFGDSR